MSPQDRASAHWARRARPLLGTLVEIGVLRADGEEYAAIDDAFAQIGAIQAVLSRFEPDSDVGRFHALRCGERITMREAMNDVMRLASDLRDASDGVFDISVGTSTWGWRCDGPDLHKLDPDVRLDLGGIGKGYAVDRAVDVLIGRGCRAGWVNAGGDLRSFGDVDVPIRVRDEQRGGTRGFALLREGAFATSDFGAGTRSRLAPATRPVHASVAAPLCAWADALTKIVASTGNASHPTLSRYDALAWVHMPAT